MWGDGCEPRPSFAYRLFAAAPDSRLPTAACTSIRCRPTSTVDPPRAHDLADPALGFRRRDGAGRAHRQVRGGRPRGRVPDRVRRGRRRPARRSCRGPRGASRRARVAAGARSPRRRAAPPASARARGHGPGAQRRGRPPRFPRVGRAVRRRGGRPRRRQHRRHRRHPRRAPARATCCATRAATPTRAGTTRPTATGCWKPRPRWRPTGCSPSTPTNASRPTTPPPSGLPRHRRTARVRLRHALLPDDRRPRPLRRRARGCTACSRTAGSRFPDTRLHFVPVPDDIPRGLWLQTTIRIQHLASLTASADAPPRQVRGGRPRRRVPGRLRPPVRAPRADPARSSRGRPGSPCSPASLPRPTARPRSTPSTARAHRRRDQPRRRGPHRAHGAFGGRAGVRRAVRGDRGHQRHRPHRGDRAREVPRRAGRRARPSGAARRGAQRRPAVRPRRLRVVPRLARRLPPAVSRHASAPTTRAGRW